MSNNDREYVCKGVKSDSRIRVLDYKERDSKRRDKEIDGDIKEQYGDK